MLAPGGVCVCGVCEAQQIKPKSTGNKANGKAVFTICHFGCGDFAALEEH